MINLRALNYFTTASTKNRAMNLVATKFHTGAPGKIINYTNRDISTWLRTKLICTCTREHPEKTEQRLIAVWHFNVETGGEGAATRSNFDGALTSLPTGAEMKPLWKRIEETWGQRWRISRLADDLYGEEGKKVPRLYQSEGFCITIRWCRAYKARASSLLITHSLLLNMWHSFSLAADIPRVHNHSLKDAIGQ